MKDPKRLSERDTSPFENRLLDAARNERVPDDMTARMSQGLNLGAAGTAAGKVATGTFLSLKTGALIVVGAAALTGLVAFGLGRGAEPREKAAAVVPQSPTPPAPTTAQSAAVAAPTANESPEPVLPPVPTTRGATRTLGSGQSSTGSRNREADLREEIGLLDEARAALAAGAPGKALVVLGQYNHRFANGTFAPEALALRVEALTDTGDTTTARALARRFLKAYPNSPLAERVERLTGLSR